MDLMISLKYKNLIYDVGLEAYIIGESIQTENNADRSNIQDVADDRKVRKIKREIRKSFYEIVNLLSGYAKQDMVTNEYVSDDLRDSESLNMVLNMPDDFNRVNIEPIKNSIHDYVVKKSLSSWFKMIDPNRSLLYEQDARNEFVSINWYMSGRTKTVRRKLNPF